MNVTITNNDDKDPIIARAVRVDIEGEAIDVRSEMEVLPTQTTNFELFEGESLVMFKR